MTIKVYSSKELSNDRYHSDEFDYASGTILSEIHSDCAASYKYGEKEETTALADGIAGHVALLEQDIFLAQFRRGIDEKEHKDALVTNKDMEGWLKDVPGVKPKSNALKSDLLTMIDATGLNPPILQRMLDSFDEECKRTGSINVPAKTYDMVVRMRTVILQNGYGELLSGGAAEISIVDDEAGEKVRLDYVNGQGDIIDYKTTISAHPEKFGLHALKMGYWLKMAMQYDLFEKAYGQKPNRTILLAQSKKVPYIPQAYELEKWQLDIGREQYRAAKRLYEACKQSGIWTAYGGGVRPLEAPGWALKMYGVDQ